ncbi:MAG: serine hydrolase domain-containing protein [Anaerolineae bacterium]
MKTPIRLLLLALVLLTGASIIHAQADVQSELDTFIDENVPADGPAVAARISIGKETWAAAGGLVDTSGSIAAAPDAHFRIASMSKTWLAVTVMQLRDKGLLSLDDAASKWLPEEITSNIANADVATVRQLLMMRSGIPEYLEDDFFNAVSDDPGHAWTPEEALQFAYGLPPSFAPDEGFEYCNTNYVLLQLIVEAAAGKPMYQVMREQIFTPLGLKDTYVQVQEKGAAFVHGYEDFDGDGQVDDLTTVNDGAGLGDGALISTTADLTRFYRGVFVDHQILSAESVQEMIDAGDNADEYGIGVEVSNGQYGLTLGHTGAVLGFTGAVYYAQDLDAVVVILYGSDGMDTAHVEDLLQIAAEAAQ